MRAFLSRYRLLLMRVLAVLAGLFFVIGTFPQAISPWGTVTLSNMDGVHDVNLHRWSAALAGGPDLGMAALLFYLAWRPLKAPAVLQWLAAAVIVFLVANVPFVGPAVALVALPVVLVLLAYPEPRKLLVAPWVDGVSVPLLALGALAAVLLIADAGVAFAAQVRNQDELAHNYDWASNGEHLINVALAALMGAMLQPGARVVGLMAGAVITFMGAAAVTVPSNPGSWGTLGGAIAIVAGLAIIAAAVIETRRISATTQRQDSGS